MRFRLRIEVSLKPGHSDPEGETTARLLKELGFKVDAVNVSKVYTMILHTGTREEARAQGEEICKRLLANPTKDNYSVVVEEQE